MVKILAQEARDYFAHASQRTCDLNPHDFNDDWMQYRAQSGVCMIFHVALWPGVWMVHIGVNPAAWGQIDAACKKLLAEFQAEVRALRIVAWIPEANRAVAALAKRVGFTCDGAMPLPGGGVSMIGWSA